jgi:hypothetical protein
VFGPAILEAAEARGIDDFFAFGEVFDQRFGSPFISEFSTEGQLQATIDFGFQVAARNFASQGGPATNLQTFFASDDYYTDADRQRLRPADVPRQPRHGAHRLLPPAGRPARRFRRRAAGPLAENR